MTVGSSALCEAFHKAENQALPVVRILCFLGPIRGGSPQGAHTEGDNFALSILAGLVYCFLLTSLVDTLATTSRHQSGMEGL